MTPEAFAEQGVDLLLWDREMAETPMWRLARELFAVLDKVLQVRGA